MYLKPTSSLECLVIMNIYLCFYCQGYDNHSSVPGEGRGTPYNDLYGEALPRTKGVPFLGFWYLKGWGFHLLKYKKGLENLSFWLIQRLKRANRSVMTVKKSWKLSGLVIYSSLKGIACVAGAKRGGGEWGRKARKGKGKGALPSLPNPPPFSLPPYNPYPFWCLLCRL